jgi:hypothetical protein
MTNAKVLKDSLPQPPSFDNVEKLIILFLVAVFIGLFIWLIQIDQLLFAYWTFSALLALVFAGILRATGIVRTSWMAFGGGTAVYIALIWVTTDTFKAYDNSAQKIAELRSRILQLESQIHADDPAKDTLVQYFDHLQNRRFADAYILVAEARKQERAREFGPDHFMHFQSSFDNTVGYDNVAVASEFASGRDRKYRVSYDVTDNIPNNEMFERRRQLFSSAAASEILNQGAIIKVVIANLNQYFIINDDVITKVKYYIGTKSIDDIFDPVFIAVLASDLRDGNKIELKTKFPTPGNIKARRHFVHDVIMVQEGAAWKIRSLATPVVANY